MCYLNDGLAVLTNLPYFVLSSGSMHANGRDSDYINLLIDDVRVLTDYVCNTLLVLC